MTNTGTIVGSPTSSAPRALHRLESRGVIRQAIGDLIRKMVLMHPTAGSVTTFTAPEIKLQPDDAFVGKIAYIYSGTGIGQTSLITDSVQNTGVATVSPNWSIAPDATSVIEVWDQDCTPAEVNQKIKDAILDAQGSTRIRKRANPLAISSDFRTIQIPSDFTHISGVIFENATANTFTEHKVVTSPAYLDEAPFAAGVLGDQIYLNPILTSATLITQIWILGFGYPAIPSSDSDIVEVRSDYVTLMAAFFLEAGRAESNQLDPENSQSRAAGWFQQAIALRTLMHVYLDPNSVEVGP